jgi:exosortase
MPDDLPTALDAASSASPADGSTAGGSATNRPVRPGAGLLFPAAFVLPTSAYGWELRETSHYQFAWLLVPAALALVPSRVRALQELRPGTTSGTWRWWGPAALLALLSVLLATPWFGVIGALLWAAGAASAVGGRPLLRALAPIWCCLWLAIRPPLDLDLYLIQELQSITARLADHLLDGLGQVHLLTGNVIAVAGKKLFVEEACSGVQSLFAGWACAWLLCLVRGHGPWRWLLLMASVPLWAIVANSLRVVTITVLWTERRIAIDAGFWHETLGLALFAVTAGLIASTDSLLGWVFPRDEVRSLFTPMRTCTVNTTPPPPVRTSLGASFRTKTESAWRGRGAAICGASLLALQALFWLGGDRLLGDGKASVRLPEFGAAALPAAIGSWRQVGYEVLTRNNPSGEGTHGQQWRFTGPHGTAIVALDYPFAGWHELSICYPAEGWELCSRNVSTTPLSQAAGTTVLTTADYRRGAEGLSGLLLFDLFDTTGKPIYETGDPLSFTTRLQRRLLRWQDRVRGPRATIQFQVFLESPEEAEATPAPHQALLDGRRRAAQELFDAARAPLTAACTAAAQRGGF